MTFLIITASKELQLQIKSFIIRYFKSNSSIYMASSFEQASLLIKSAEPLVILSEYKIGSLNLFSLVDEFKPGNNRHYFLIEKRKELAIKAIRAGIAGIFDFIREKEQLHKTLKNIASANTQGLSAKQNLISLSTSNAIILQTQNGFEKIKLSDLFYIELEGDKLHYGLYGERTLVSNQSLFFVANQLNQDNLKILSSNFIVNLDKVVQVIPDQNSCVIVFDDSSVKYLTGIQINELTQMK